MDEEYVSQLNRCKVIMEAVFSMGASYQIASAVIEANGENLAVADHYADIASQLIQYSQPLNGLDSRFNLVEYLMGVIKIISDDDLAPYVQNYFLIDSELEN